MSKPLRIIILEYLSDEDAVDKKIDVGSKFLESDDSREARLSLSNALKYLNDEGLIVLSGRPIELLNTTAGQFSSKYHTGLLASITIKGEQFLQKGKALNSILIESKVIDKQHVNKEEFVFVSHSSLDKNITTLFIDKILKLILKIDSNNIFCTSLQETAIKSGSDFRKEIKENLEKASLVIQIISENYKQSEVCLNEMGAAWVCPTY